MVRLSAFVVGLFFGLGLAISGMTQPGKVIAFLDFGGAWDPSLAFVMGGALSVFGPVFFLVRRKRQQPVLTEKFDLPTRTKITPELMVGAVFFGAGWGLGGFCPGTAVTSIPTVSARVLLFVAAFMLGILSTWGMQKALAEDGSAVRPQADF